ncbi:MAG TPA: nucleotidyl transferase AbiEii/AbiGii toxin family protein [Acidimicrobiales bacterium]|nr:nucleotidyl transferase AbiEii/AbiGii toxin family protein [Acidimicrobiales bacterium]
MSRPTRTTAAGRAYLDLQARARSERRPTDELLVLYVLERFLYRLSRSPHRSRLVLKGGMLLAAFEERRPTRDVDLLAREVSNDLETVARLVHDVLLVGADDGVEFRPDRLAMDVIRDGDVYPGARVVVPAAVHRARLRLRIDVSVGDPVTPGVVEVDYPSLLAESFRVVGYPIETVLAEKIVTMVDRGDATTRERDFADVVLLARRHEIDAVQLSAAIGATGAHRQSELRPLRQVLVTLGASRQTDWARFVDRAGLRTNVPPAYEEAIGLVVDFADPILAGAVVTGTWDPTTRSWRS